MYIVDFQYNFYTNKNYRLLIKSLFMYKPIKITLYICFFAVLTVCNCIYINYYYNGNFLIKFFYTRQKTFNPFINYQSFIINKTIINKFD